MVEITWLRDVSAPRLDIIDIRYEQYNTAQNMIL